MIVQRHQELVQDAAAEAYAERRGNLSAEARCDWEGDRDGVEMWNCAIQPPAADRCVVLADGSDVAINRCDGDLLRIGRAVGRAYAARTGSSRVPVSCGVRLPDEGGGTEAWRCLVGSPGSADRDTCTAGVDWRSDGGVRAAIEYCDSKMEPAVRRQVERAYARVAGLAGVTARCVSDYPDPLDWECSIMHPRRTDTCAVTMRRTAGGTIDVRLRYCRNEAAA